MLLTLLQGLNVGKEIWWLTGCFRARSDPCLPSWHGQEGRMPAMGTLPPLLTGAWPCSEYRNLSGLICGRLVVGGAAGHPPALLAACGAHCGYARAEVLRRSTWLDIKGNWIIKK